MRIVLVFFFSFIFQLPAAGQAPQVEALLRREMRERRIPGLQIAVVQNQRIVLLESFGTADIQHSVPTTNKTVFPIYSCTKAFTGVAIMQLVEEGKVDLEAPVSRYLDILPESWKAITIKQLLTHVSGLPNILSVLDPVNYGLPKGMNETEAAKRLNVTPSRVRAMIVSKRLKVIRVGIMWLIDPKDLDAVKNRKVGRPRKARKSSKR